MDAAFIFTGLVLVFGMVAGTLVCIIDLCIPTAYDKFRKDSFGRLPIYTTIRYCQGYLRDKGFSNPRGRGMGPEYSLKIRIVRCVACFGDCRNYPKLSRWSRSVISREYDAWMNR